jgi:hypothetical protein
MNMQKEVSSLQVQSDSETLVKQLNHEVPWPWRLKKHFRQLQIMLWFFDMYLSCMSIVKGIRCQILWRILLVC